MSNPKHERFASGSGPRDSKTKSTLPAVFYAQLQDEREMLKEEARRVLTLRQRRVEHFGQAMFSEPGWEMILELYASDCNRMEVSSLFALVGLSGSIGQRWLDHLDAVGLVEFAHNSDGAPNAIALTDRCRFALEAFLTETRAFVPNKPG